MSNFSAISWREQVTFDDDGDDNVCRLFLSLLCKLSETTGRSVLLVEETGVPRENHRPVASH
jgi:hypothetical protein